MRAAVDDLCLFEVHPLYAERIRAAVDRLLEAAPSDPHVLTHFRKMTQ